MDKIVGTIPSKKEKSTKPPRMAKNKTVDYSEVVYLVFSLPSDIKSEVILRVFSSLPSIFKIQGRLNRLMTLHGDTARSW